MFEPVLLEICSIIQYYITNYINEFFVKPKISRHIIVIIYAITFMLGNYIILYFNLGTICKHCYSFITLFVLVVMLYKGSMKQKIMAYVENIVITLLCDLILTELIYGLLGLSTDISVSYSHIGNIMVFVCSVMQIPIVYFMGKIHKKIRLNLNKNQLRSIIVIIVVLSAVSWIYDMRCGYAGIYMGNTFLFFVLCLIVFCIYIFRTMVLMEVKNETEESISNMSKQNKMVMEYYEDISYKISNLSELRETYESKLKEVYKQAGKEYESKANADEYRYKHIQCENTVVDNIIANVCIDLDRMKCEYDIDMNIPDSINIEAMDLASIFINLFDNALSAIEGYVGWEGKSLPDKNDLSSKSDLARKSNRSGRNENYHLMAYADYGDDGLTIEVKNVKSKSAKIRRMNDIFITTKENKEAHGYGMQIIKRIAKKYNGTMEVEYDETSFVNQVTLKV